MSPADSGDARRSRSRPPPNEPHALHEHPGRFPHRPGDLNARPDDPDACPVERPRRTPRRAFSLVELVIVVVIIAIVGAIAVPRMSSSAQNAATGAVVGDTSTLQKAIDLYEAEHIGQRPGDAIADNTQLYSRLLATTHLDGTVDADGIYGPYINAIPANKINGKASIRIDGAPNGANTHGWRYDTATGTIEPDHAPGATTFRGGDAITQTGGKLTIEGGKNLGGALGGALGGGD